MKNVTNISQFYGRPSLPIKKKKKKKITNLQKSHKINKNKKIEKMKKIFRKIPHKIITDHDYQI